MIKNISTLALVFSIQSLPGFFEPEVQERLSCDYVYFERAAYDAFIKKPRQLGYDVVFCEASFIANVLEAMSRAQVKGERYSITFTLSAIFALAARLNNSFENSGAPGISSASLHSARQVLGTLLHLAIDIVSNPLAAVVDSVLINQAFLGVIKLASKVGDSRCVLNLCRMIIDPQYSFFGPKLKQKARIALAQRLLCQERSVLGK